MVRKRSSLITHPAVTMLLVAGTTRGAGTPRGILPPPTVCISAHRPTLPQQSPTSRRDSNLVWRLRRKCRSLLQSLPPSSSSPPPPPREDPVWPGTVPTPRTQNLRFFTGNQAIDSAAWGAALGFKRGLDKVVITEVPLIKSISILLSHFNSFEKEFRKWML